MSDFIEQYPIIASLLGFVLAVAAGAIDLVVLQNRALAIAFWVLCFPLAVTPILSKQSWGDLRWFLGLVVAAAYLSAVVWIYRVLVHAKRSEKTGEEQA